MIEHDLQNTYIRAPVEWTENDKTATTLWAIYYAITEQYDRTLTHARTDRETAAVSYDPEARGKSSRFAKRLSQMIGQRAAGIDNKTWMTMGRDVQRWRHEDQMAYLRRDPQRWGLYREVRAQAGFR